MTMPCAGCSNPSGVDRQEHGGRVREAMADSARITAEPRAAGTVATTAETDVASGLLGTTAGTGLLVANAGQCETRSVGSQSSEPTGASAAYHTGKLLVATPAVEGDAFRRSVILMLHHDADGAQGVVLNHPLEAAVDAVLPGWQAVATAPRTLFRGGPVGTDSAIGIVSVPGEREPTLGVRRLFRGIGVVDLDAPPPLVAPEVAGLRIFAGYAGWSGGQLEGEIRRGDWYVVEAEPRDAFSDTPANLWEVVLRRQRDNLALVAFFPDDPSMN